MSAGDQSDVAAWTAAIGAGRFDIGFARGRNLAAALGDLLDRDMSISAQTKHGQLAGRNGHRHRQSQREDDEPVEDG